MGATLRVVRSSSMPSWQAQASVYVYDPATNHWRDGVDLPPPNAEDVVATVASQVCVVGGRVRATADARHFNAHMDTAQALVFDLAATRAPMPQAQGGLAAEAWGGRLYVFGGEQWVREQKVFADG